MNCVQVEKLLPLYSGRELEDGRKCLVEMHVQSCATCAGVVAEYREARGFMRAYAASTVSEDVYAEVRRNVWRRIEADARPSLVESIAVFFRSRLVWTTAIAAVLISVSTAGLYFLSSRPTPREAVVTSHGPAVQPQMSPEPRPDGSLNNGNIGGTQRQAFGPKGQRKPSHFVPPGAAAVVAYSPEMRPPKSESAVPIIGTENLDLSTRDSENILRMELQTRNPNIRIIWFAPKDPKPVVGNSKGI